MYLVYFELYFHIKNLSVHLSCTSLPTYCIPILLPLVHAQRIVHLSNHSTTNSKIEKLPLKERFCGQACIQDWCEVSLPPLQRGEPTPLISPSRRSGKNILIALGCLGWASIFSNKPDGLTFFLSPLFAPAAFMPSSIFSKTLGTPTNLAMIWST